LCTPGRWDAWAGVWPARGRATPAAVSPAALCLALLDAQIAVETALRALQGVEAVPADVAARAVAALQAAADRLGELADEVDPGCLRDAL
jgi:hypothetical protein